MTPAPTPTPTTTPTESKAPAPRPPTTEELLVAAKQRIDELTRERDYAVEVSADKASKAGDIRQAVSRIQDVQRDIANDLMTVRDQTYDGAPVTAMALAHIAGNLNNLIKEIKQESFSVLDSLGDLPPMPSDYGKSQEEAADEDD